MPIYFSFSIVILSLFAGQTPPPTKVTRENFRLLKDGMSQAEIEKIFGAKGERWTIIGSQTGLEIPLKWTGEGVAKVILLEDRGIVMKFWIEKGFSSPTKTNFDQVKTGMTVAEVKKLFGREPDSYWYSPNEVTTGRWRDIDGCGGMDFDHGKVRQKWWGTWEYPVKK